MLETIPRNYVESAEFNCQVHDRAEAVLQPLIDLLGRDHRSMKRVEWSDLREPLAFISLEIPVSPVESGRPWDDGRDSYYDPAPVELWDPRPELLAALLRCVQVLKKDIQERPRP